MHNQKLLSICIPTYNRSSFLKESLQKILYQITDYNDDVEILVSDNCSTDNTQSIIEELKKEGHIINYNRNQENLGMDGNFAYCFNNAKGKYIWLLGDDDFLRVGSVLKVINILKHDEFGLVHLNTAARRNGTEIFTSAKKYLNEININITFISGNIVNSAAVRNIDFNRYKGTLFTQVPVYLNATVNFEKNIIIYDQLLETSMDGVTNGGYNIFEVFVINYLKILAEFRVNLGFGWYEIQKYKLCRNFIWPWMSVLFLNPNHGLRFITKDWFKIIFSKFWYELYIYPMFILFGMKKLISTFNFGNRKE